MINEAMISLPDFVLMFKKGKFFYAYGKSAFMISGLFDYKLNNFQDTFVVGFPNNSLKKVQGILDSKSISYVFIDQSYNFMEIEKGNYKNKNMFDKIYPIMHNTSITKYKIEKFSYYLKSLKYCKETQLLIENISTLINEHKNLSEKV